MLLLITSALVETLTKHMFNNHLDERDKIEIGGAPSWYMMPVEDKMCVFAHKSGGLDMIDLVKDNSKLKMIKKINGTIDIVIYENMKNVQNEKEKEVINKWNKDSNLPVFINQNLEYNRVKYEDEIETTFVRACIPNQTIITYQTERLSSIKKEVLKYKSKSALDEMDMELNGGSNKPKDPDDPFAELP